MEGVFFMRGFKDSKDFRLTLGEFFTSPFGDVKKERWAFLRVVFHCFEPDSGRVRPISAKAFGSARLVEQQERKKFALQVLLVFLNDDNKNTSVRA